MAMMFRSGCYVFDVRCQSSPSSDLVGEKSRKCSLCEGQRILLRRAERSCGAMLQKGITSLRPLSARVGKRGVDRTDLHAQSPVTVMDTVRGSGENPIPPYNGPDDEHSLNKLLVELRNGRGPWDGRIVFPPTFSARQRRRAHEIAERLGLGHISLDQGSKRYFTSWRMSVAERLSQLHKSWRVLESQGILLHNASVIEREFASFGRERWVLADGVGIERAGHVVRFSQRARPGMPICLAERDSSGSWMAAKGQPPGRVAWSRGKKICVVFDHPPSSVETNSADVLLVPDSSSFERMRSVLRDCELADKGMDLLLGALLGSRVLGPTRSASVTLSPSEDWEVDHWTKDTVITKELQGHQLTDKGLNMEQCAAVKLCTQPGESPIALIHGPFGTGKTRTLVEVVLQQVKAGRRVLVCAASNAAVDNMVQALLTADLTLPLARAGLTERVSSNVAAYTMEALQDSQPEAAIARRLRKEAYAMQLTAEKWTRAASGGEKRRNARKEVNALFKDARRLDNMCATSVLQRTKVFCGTLTGFASVLRDLGDAEEARFDCAVIDEASQAITPALLLVLPYLKYPDNKECTKVPMFMMFGDHQQLPPTVLSEDLNDKGGGLKATLFEELMERDGGGLGTRIVDLISNREQWESAKLSILRKACALAYAVEDGTQQPDSSESSFIGYISVALHQQYRMPAQLMAFPSAAFYGAKLISKKTNVVIMELQDEGSFLQSGLLLEVIDTAGAGCEEVKTGEILMSSAKSQAAVEVFSTSNPGQANLTARVVRELLSSATWSASDIGVVTPYSAQVMLLQELLVDEVDAGLEIDSVDAYQGREKEVIVLDAVRSNMNGSVGFLSDFRRLNVSITRARHKLVVIGDSATLSIDPIWAVFFEWVSDYREKASTGIRYRSFFELPNEGSW